MANGGKGDEIDLVRALAKRPVKLAELERIAIEATLQRTGGNILRAARQLGIGRTTLYRKLGLYAAAGHVPIEPAPVAPTVDPIGPSKWSKPGRASLGAYHE
jgi:hypothetical protein